MKMLCMLHTLDVNVGEETSTVRNGLKWSNISMNEQLKLSRCLHEPGECDQDSKTHEELGIGQVIALWVGQFREIPARLIKNEHEVRSRTYDGLLESMRLAYGETFSEDSLVSIVSYKRVA